MFCLYVVSGAFLVCITGDCVWHLQCEGCCAVEKRGEPAIWVSSNLNGWLSFL